MVTPNRRSIRAMVILWWVMIRKRVFSSRVISSSRVQKRSTLASSRGASTSSKTHMGAGFVKNTPKRSASAVNACSPPDRSESTCSFLPGGLAIISRPASSGSSDSVSARCAPPPPNKRTNSFWKCLSTSLNEASSRARPSRFNSEIP